MSYKHLSIEEREKISKMYYAGAKNSEIANSIGRNKSTVSRELKRLGDNEYSCIRVQADYTEKRKKCCPKMKLSDEKLSAEVESLLNIGLTPEQIVGRAKEENGTSLVSQRTIYKAVNPAMLLYFTADKLPCRGRRKKYAKDERRRNASAIRHRLRLFWVLSPHFAEASSDSEFFCCTWFDNLTNQEVKVC